MTHIEQFKVTKQTDPGPLHGDASILIQTYDARRMVFGRRRNGTVKAGIVGLMQFAGKVNRVWEAAKQDDPYADWYLLRLEEAFYQARDQIRQDLTAANECFTGLPEGVQVQMATSKGLQIPLAFASPYGYMGAYIVADYDVLVRRVRTGIRHALISGVQGSELIGCSGSRIRSAFTLVTRWQHLAITRADVRPPNPRAKMAQALMGIVPPAVLAGTQRANHAPEIIAVDQSETGLLERLA